MGVETAKKHAACCLMGNWLIWIYVQKWLLQQLKQAHVCEHLARDRFVKRSGRDLNLQPAGCRSDAVTIVPVLLSQLRESVEEFAGAGFLTHQGPDSQKFLKT